MPQTAQVHGHGNVVVQIVGDGNAVTVAGAVALRLTSYAQPAYSTAPPRAEKAGEPGFTQSGRSVVRVLSPYNHESLPFQGREEMLATLKAWLAAPGGVSVQALIGAGGRGKTRLAAEIAAWARAQDWTAGFARRDDLDVFRSAGCRTLRDSPCLVVVDYAAAKSAEVGAWLRSLAHAEEEGPPLRLLLLERTGGAGAAWWRGLFDQPGPEGEAVREMLGRGAPLTVGALTDPAERYAVFAAAYGQARHGAVPRRNAWLDHALVEASLGGEPLFLAMFGLVAAQQGLTAAQVPNQEWIAIELAKQEIKRIERHWTAHGLKVGAERALHAHLASVITMCEGLTEAEAHDAIARESVALYQAITGDQTEAARAALNAALPRADGGLATIVPDILGGAVLLHTFVDHSIGLEALSRALPVAGDRVKRVILRASLDFPHHSFPRKCLARLVPTPAMSASLAAKSWMPAGNLKEILSDSKDTGYPDFGVDARQAVPSRAGLEMLDRVDPAPVGIVGRVGRVVSEHGISALAKAPPRSPAR